MRPRSKRLRAVARVLAAVALMASPLAAQGSSAPWRNSLYPYFPSLGNNFPLIALHIEERKGAPYEARTPYSGLFSVDLGQGFTGARMAVARFQAPLLIPGWRVSADLGTTRETRLGFYGLGNNAQEVDSLVNSSQPHYYQARRTRYFTNLEITKHIAGPLYLAGAGGAEYSNLSSLSGPTLFQQTFGSGDLSDTDIRGRVTLVLDGRDNEFNTAKGYFGQFSFGGGSGGTGYTRVSADVRGYLQVRDGTVIAVRVAGSSLSRGAPLNAEFELPEWENEISVLGGASSNRGLAFQRLVGSGVLFGNAEIRHDLLNLGDLGALTVLAFVDAGRVFDTGQFKLTTRDMKVGGGGGLALRLLRFTIWTFNFGTGPDGFQFSAGSGWSF